MAALPPVPTGTPIDFLQIASILSMAGGAAGTLFGGDDETERLLKERLKGIDPKILAEMRRRARGAIGNQATAERVSTGQKLGRADAPVAKRQEIEDKIRTRQFGAIGEAMSDIDFMNEQIKSGALSDLAGYTERRDQDKGQGYASLFGAGFSGLMQGNQLEELERIYKGGGATFQRNTFGSSGLPPQNHNYLNNFTGSFGRQ